MSAAFPLENIMTQIKLGLFAMAAGVLLRSFSETAAKYGPVHAVGGISLLLCVIMIGVWFLTLLKK